MKTTIYKIAKKVCQDISSFLLSLSTLQRIRSDVYVHVGMYVKNSLLNTNSNVAFFITLKSSISSHFLVIVLLSFILIK